MTSHASEAPPGGTFVLARRRRVEVTIVAPILTGVGLWLAGSALTSGDDLRPTARAALALAGVCHAGVGIALFDAVLRRIGFEHHGIRAASPIRTRFVAWEGVAEVRVQIIDTAEAGRRPGTTGAPHPVGTFRTGVSVPKRTRPDDPFDDDPHRYVEPVSQAWVVDARGRARMGFGKGLGFPFFARLVAEARRRGVRVRIDDRR